MKKLHEFTIKINGKYYAGESAEKLPNNGLGQGFQNYIHECNDIAVGDNPYILEGYTNLKSALDKIIKSARTHKNVESIEINRILF